MLKNIIKLLSYIWFGYLVLVSLLTLVIAIYTKGNFDNIYETNVVINIICNYTILFTYLIVPMRVLFIDMDNFSRGLVKTFQKH